VASKTDLAQPVTQYEIIDVAEFSSASVCLKRGSTNRPAPGAKTQFHILASDGTSGSSGVRPRWKRGSQNVGVTRVTEVCA